MGVDILALFGDTIKEDDNNLDTEHQDSQSKQSEQSEQSETPDSKNKTTKNKKSSKVKTRKSSKYKAKTLKNPREVLSLNSVSPEILDNARLLSFGYEDLNIETKNSWQEMFILLMGSLHQKFGNCFEEMLTTKPIINNTIEICKDTPMVMDCDIDKTEMFEIPMTEYKIVFKHTIDYNETLLNGIKNLLSLLWIQPKDVEIDLCTKEYFDSSLNSDSNSYLNEGLSVLTQEYTLTEICKYGLSPYIKINYCSFYDEPGKADSIRQAVEMLLILFINNLDKPKVLSTLEKYTNKDIVGITKDATDYLGFIKTTYLPGSDYHFYSNGVELVMLKYLRDVCVDLDIDPSEIKFNLEVLHSDY